MLEYERIVMSEGIDTNKTKESCRCIFSDYYYFVTVNFGSQPKTCDGSYDLMQKAISFNNVAIVLVKGNEYRINFWYMSKDKAVNII